MKRGKHENERGNRDCGQKWSPYETGIAFILAALQNFYLS